MRVVAICFVLTVFALCTLTHAAIHDPKPRPIHVIVTPAISFAPTTLTVRVRVQPIPDDRWIMVVLDGEDFYRRSDFTIEGDRALYSWDWKDVPAGDYIVSAAIGSAQARSSDRAQVLVQGS